MEGRSDVHCSWPVDQPTFSFPTVVERKDTADDDVDDTTVPTTQYLDPHGIEYLQSFQGKNNNGDEHAKSVLELEVDRLQCENKMLKRVANDLVHKFGDLAAALVEIDNQRNDVLEMAQQMQQLLQKDDSTTARQEMNIQTNRLLKTAKKMDTFLGNAVEIFPDEDEISSYEWLIER